MLIVLLLGGVVSAVVAALLGGDDNPSASPRPSSTTSSTEAPSGPARDLVARLTEAHKKPVRLVFGGTATAANGEPVTLTYELAWEGTRTLQHLILETKTKRSETLQLALPDGNVACDRPPASPWTCQPAASVASATGQPASVFDSIAAQLTGPTVTVTQAKVGAEQADCYTLTPDMGVLVCMNADDVPVKFGAGGNVYVVTTIEHVLHDDAFTPPAEVKVPATTSPSTAN